MVLDDEEDSGEGGRKTRRIAAPLVGAAGLRDQIASLASAPPSAAELTAQAAAAILSPRGYAAVARPAPLPPKLAATSTSNSTRRAQSLDSRATYFTTGTPHHYSVTHSALAPSSAAPPPHPHRLSSSTTPYDSDRHSSHLSYPYQYRHSETRSRSGSPAGVQRTGRVEIGLPTPAGTDSAPLSPTSSVSPPEFNNYSSMRSTAVPPIHPQHSQHPTQQQAFQPSQFQSYSHHYPLQHFSTTAPTSGLRSTSVSRLSSLENLRIDSGSAGEGRVTLAPMRRGTPLVEGYEEQGEQRGRSETRDQGVKAAVSGPGYYTLSNGNGADGMEVDHPSHPPGGYSPSHSRSTSSTSRSTSRRAGRPHSTARVINLSSTTIGGADLGNDAGAEIERLRLQISQLTHRNGFLESKMKDFLESKEQQSGQRY